MMEILNLSTSELINMCLEWKADMKATGEWDKIQDDFDTDPRKCPLHAFAKDHGLCKKTNGGTKKCEICGHYICPYCNSHCVDIMSRVTGYLQAVSGWNTAKKQEFEDRTRHTIQ